jgi:hypothetical protein
MSTLIRKNGNVDWFDERGNLLAHCDEETWEMLNRPLNEAQAKKFDAAFSKSGIGSVKVNLPLRYLGTFGPPLK